MNFAWQLENTKILYKLTDLQNYYITMAGLDPICPFIANIPTLISSYIMGTHTYLLSTGTGILVLLKKAGAGHFTESVPGFLRRFHWRFLAQNLIFYMYQKKFKI